MVFAVTTIAFEGQRRELMKDIFITLLLARNICTNLMDCILIWYQIFIDLLLGNYSFLRSCHILHTEVLITIFKHSVKSFSSIFYKTCPRGMWCGKSTSQFKLYYMTQKILLCGHVLWELCLAEKNCKYICNMQSFSALGVLHQNSTES